MQQWAKIINEQTKEVLLGAGQTPAYYAAIGMREMEVEQAYNGRWYVKGYAPVKPQPTVEEQIEIIKQQLRELDLKSARPMRALLSNTATEDDRTFLAGLETQAEDLRQQIKELQGA